MSGPPPKSKGHDSVRKAMLEAAERVFARKGFSAAKVAEIADEAGYTAPALYRYFAGKQEIFEGVLEAALEVISDTTASLPPASGTSFEREVDVLFEATFDMLDRHARTFLTLAAIQTSGQAVPGRKIAARELDTLERTRTLVAQRLAVAATANRLGHLDAREAARFFDALCLGVFLRWAPEKAYGGGGPFRENLDFAKRAFLSGVGYTGATATERKRRATTTARPKR
jgi:AcrR family transcriptional regulator